MKTSIGFIGAGNIVGAILTGVEKSGRYPAETIGIFDVSQDTCDRYAKAGYTIYPSIEALTEGSDVVVAAVTPQVMGSVAGNIKAAWKDGKVLLSVAAGISNQWYRERIAPDCKVVRCMPTLTAQASEGAFAVTPTDNLSAEEYGQVRAFLESCGIVEEIPENLMCEVVPINGSAPAYFYHMAKVVVDEAVAMGFEADTALKLFAQTMKGSAETLLSSGMSPAELENKLRLPGGTTLAALDKMDALGFDKCLTEGVKACVDKCRELSQL